MTTEKLTTFDAARSSQSPVIILLLGLSGVGKTFFISNAIKTELESRQTLGSGQHLF